MDPLYYIETWNEDRFTGVESTDDFHVWAAYVHDVRRIVKRTETPFGTVSTVFLGLDNSFGEGPPILYETMIVDGVMDVDGDYQWRYCTRADALLHHYRIVDGLKAKHT
jgi:hypothetical protein